MDSVLAPHCPLLLEQTTQLRLARALLVLLAVTAIKVAVQHLAPLRQQAVDSAQLQIPAHELEVLEGLEAARLEREQAGLAIPRPQVLHKAARAGMAALQTQRLAVVVGHPQQGRRDKHLVAVLEAQAQPQQFLDRL